MNSTLHISLLRDELGQGAADLELPASLLERAKLLRDAASMFAQLNELELGTSAAWRELQSVPEVDPARKAKYEAFVARKQEFGAETSRVLGLVRELWPASSRTAEVDDVIVALLEAEEAQADPAKYRLEYQRFQALLEARIEDLSAEVASGMRMVATTAKPVIERRKLRIEAFLIPAESPIESHAVHVEGYDELDAKEVRRVDAQGLLLTESERRYLLDLMGATREAATALEKVRTSETTLSQAFSGSSTALGKALEARIDKIQTLLKDLENEKLAAMLAEAKAAFEELLDKAGEDLKARLELTKLDLDALADLSTKAREILTTMSALAGRWQNPADRRKPELVLETLSAAASLGQILSSKDALASFGDWLGRAKKVVSFELDSATRAALETLLVTLKPWEEMGSNVLAEARTLYVLLAGAPSPPADLDLTSPGAFDLPLDMAPDATIDLKSTTRKAGDYLVVKATLLDGDAKIDECRSRLRLEKLGWHADLVPAVVYIEADRVSGADDSGGFSASLGWMWSYGARDDEADPYLSRLLGWSAGMHAALLSFAPDNDPEIGLGASLGFWDGRIQIGAGYNLFADDSGDGRWYYYVGSSLIPLVQALSTDS